MGQNSKAMVPSTGSSMGLSIVGGWLLREGAGGPGLAPLFFCLSFAWLVFIGVPFTACQGRKNSEGYYSSSDGPIRTIFGCFAVNRQAIESRWPAFFGGSNFGIFLGVSGLHFVFQEFQLGHP